MRVVPFRHVIAVIASLGFGDCSVVPSAHPNAFVAMQQRTLAKLALGNSIISRDSGGRTPVLEVKPLDLGML
jgi:hypothetical protein